MKAFQLVCVVPVIETHRYVHKKFETFFNNTLAGMVCGDRREQCEKIGWEFAEFLTGRTFSGVDDWVAQFAGKFGQGLGEHMVGSQTRRFQEEVLPMAVALYKLTSSAVAYSFGDEGTSESLVRDLAAPWEPH